MTWKQQAPGLSGVFADNGFVDEAIQILKKIVRRVSLVSGHRSASGWEGREQEKGRRERPSGVKNEASVKAEPVEE
jgi:hypothetical protein